ncbi:MAG: hypothetical protein J7L86_08520 [Candidatus Marinimicrobia bacterium]|nr:hypothetical protein [Candidatus Neomarinimicrobiota bacterium]
MFIEQKIPQLSVQLFDSQQLNQLILRNVVKHGSCDLSGISRRGGAMPDNEMNSKC